MPGRTAAIAAILFALLTLLPSETPARTAREWQATGWVTDFEQGLERANAAGQLAFVYFDAAWCSWCHQ
jgi:hypothetical protein